MPMEPLGCLTGEEAVRIRNLLTAVFTEKSSEFIGADPVK